MEDTPVYQKIMLHLKKEIENQAANTPILSERELADKLNVSRMTVRKAIRKLVDDGLLYRKDHLGTFVADQKLHKVNTSDSFANPFGVEAEFRVIYFDVKNGDKIICDHLGIPEDHYFIRIVRINYVDVTPESVNKIYINRRLVDEKMMRDPIMLLTYSSSFEIASCKQTFIPMIVPTELANLLKVNIGTPIIRVDSTLYTKDGKTYAFVESFVNPNSKQIVFTL